MIRVAVAGTNTLALMIAHYIKKDTNHQLVILSRQAQPFLTQQEYQVLVVDYDDPSSVQHALLGVHTVISTVMGSPQLQLLEAAIANGVRRFAPAEFHGRPCRRPANDPLDRDKSTMLAWLQHYRSQIESTIFVCGVLYERFGPGGLALHRLGLGSDLSGEGDYVMDVRTMATYAPIYDADAQLTVTVCMTAAQDVAKYVVKALNLRTWPPEMTMCGEKMTIYALTRVVQEVRGRAFQSVLWHTPDSLRSELQLAEFDNDVPRQMRAHDHIATAEGRYDYAQFSLNVAFPDVEPVKFRDWLAGVWAGVE